MRYLGFILVPILLVAFAAMAAVSYSPQTGTYSVQTGDCDGEIRLTNETASTVTFETDTAPGPDVGNICEIIQLSTGAIKIDPIGNGGCSPLSTLCHTIVNDLGGVPMDFGDYMISTSGTGTTITLEYTGNFVWAVTAWFGTFDQE